MSEKLRLDESSHNQERIVSPEHHAETLKHKQELAEQARKTAEQTNVESLRKQVAEHAPEGKLPVDKHDKDSGEAYGSHHLLKKTSYQQTLQSIRRQLPKPLRSFSKVVHSPVIETISNTSAKTVARPSGLLGGGIGAFLGSAFLLYMSKNYGYSSYNYALFILLFVGGFVIGLVFELLVWAIWRHRHNI